MPWESARAWRDDVDANGRGLVGGKLRWVVERTRAWWHQNRRLRVRDERRVEIHDAFLEVGCILLCDNPLNSSFCERLLIIIGHDYDMPFQQGSEESK
jgi:hypothetical protein